MTTKQPEESKEKSEGEVDVTHHQTENTDEKPKRERQEREAKMKKFENPK